MTENSQPQRPRPRIESLGDLIFGLALSVGAITLVTSPPKDSQGVYADIFTFGFSFLILISIWLRYTNIMSVFPLESSVVVNLNVALLFFVAIEPFLFNLLNNTAGVADIGAYANATSTLYALDLGAMFAILGAFTLILANEERRLIPRELIRKYRFQGGSMVATAAFFMLTALPIFFSITASNGEPVRYYLWAAPLAWVFVSRRIQKRLLGEKETE